MDIADINAGATAFNTALQALQSLKSLLGPSPAAGKIADIQTALINAQQSSIHIQQAHSAQVDAIRLLEAKIAAFETWDTQKQRYELKDLGDSHSTNVLAYRLKDSEQISEPAHSICPDCYERRVKSILQHITRTPGIVDVRICQQCGWEGYVSGMWMPEHSGKLTSRRR